MAKSAGAPDDDGPSPAPESVDKPKTVTIHCAIPQGFVMSFMGDPDRMTDQGLTVPVDVHKRFQVKLKSGLNPGISADQWERWLAENQSYSAVVSGHIYAIAD